MLLGNAHVKTALRIAPAEGRESRALRHRRRHRDDVRILRRELNQGLGKHIGVIRILLVLFRDAGCQFKGSHTVKKVRMPLRGAVALALLRNDMHENGARQASRLLKDTHQLFDVVPVHGTQIGHAEVFEKHARNKELLNAVLCGPKALDHVLSDAGNREERLRDILFQTIVSGRSSYGIQIGRHAAHIFGNRHAVVV